MLIAAGADVHHANDYGETALILASRTAQVAIVQQLLDCGVDASRVDSRGWSALLYATRSIRLEVVMTLLASGQKLDVDRALGIAAENGNVDMIKLLLAHCANLECTNRYGQTPLISACCRGDQKSVLTLLEAGADVDATDTRGVSALFEAVRFGKWRAARVLLTWGADPNAGPHYARSALEMARIFCPHSRRMMELLQAHSAVDLDQSRAKRMLS